MLSSSFFKPKKWYNNRLVSQSLFTGIVSDTTGSVVIGNFTGYLLFSSN